MPAVQTDFLVRYFSCSGVFNRLYEVRKLEVRIDFGEVQILMAEQLLHVTNGGTSRRRCAVGALGVGRILGRNWTPELRTKSQVIEIYLSLFLENLVAFALTMRESPGVLRL
jgi:hypothetical protein